MRETEKLFRKITAKERKQLLHIVECLQGKDHKGLGVKKLQGSDLYRVRKGRFRIVFHYEQKAVVVDSIRLRNEKTYK